MKKKTIVKILLCGLFVFLLLPAVFDEDNKETPKKSAFENATSFSPSEDADTIPIIENDKESIFKKYSRKFKKMYGKVLFGVPAGEEDGVSFAKAKNTDDSDSNVDLSSAMSYLLSDDKSASARSSYNEDYEEETMGALFYDSYTDSYVVGSSMPVRQTMHDNAPVKGLYETSLIESPESKVKATQVYNSVMRKVERPSVITENGKRLSQKQEISAGNLPENNYAKPIQNNAVEQNNNLQNFNRKYVGIASRNSSNGNKDSRGGELYAYKKGTFGSLRGSGILPDIESVTGHAAGRVSSAATTMREENATRSAGNGTEPSGNGQTDEGNVPASSDNTKPEEQEKPFDTSLYPEITEAEVSECAESEEIELWDEDTAPEETDNNAGQSDQNGTPKLEATAETESSDKEDDIIKACDRALPFYDIQVSREIGVGEGGQNRVIIDLGAVNVKGKPMRRTLTPDSYSNLSYTGLKRIGVDNLATGEGIDKVFSAISDSDFKKYLNDSNNVAVIITNDAKVQQKYPDRTVLIQDGDFIKISKLKSLASNLNKIDVEKVKENIIAQAKAREEARNSQYKGEITGADKYAAED